MSKSRLFSEFIDRAQNRILVTARLPVTYRHPTKALLVVPPFAEEMNKSRKLISDFAKLLSEQGTAVVLVDLSGTGDSSGDFSTATWQGWLEDLEATHNWMIENNLICSYLLGIRLGCLLAANWVKYFKHEMKRTIFWQPVSSGKQALTQFLRIRIAAQAAGGQGKETVSTLRSLLISDHSVQVAGYSLSGKLAAEIDEKSLTDELCSGLGELYCIEINNSDQSSIPPSIKVIKESAEDLSINFHYSSVPGFQFWTASEIVQNSELIGASAITCLQDI